MLLEISLLNFYCMWGGAHSFCFAVQFALENLIKEIAFYFITYLVVYF